MTLLSAILLSLLALQWLSAPFVWIGLLWMICLGWLCRWLVMPTARLVLIYSAAVICALTLFESYLWLSAPTQQVRMEDIYEHYVQQQHPILGYAPYPNTVRPSAKKYVDDQLIYDVIYTIDAHGLRKSSDVMPTQPQRCVVFFGCSFTFGEGVNDTESLPYQVSRRLGPRYNVYNFGFHGYGPHQMLAALEQGLVAKIVQCQDDIHFIYQALPYHVQRANGLTTWDLYGPRYRLDTHGTAVLSGHFDEQSFTDNIVERLNLSKTYSRLFGNDRTATAADIALFIAIVKKAAALTQSQFPSSQFQVIYWDVEGKASNSPNLVPYLRTVATDLHLISTWFGDAWQQQPRYRIPYDRHPSALAHAKIADAVVAQLLQPPPP